MIDILLQVGNIALSMVNYAIHIIQEIQHLLVKIAVLALRVENFDMHACVKFYSLGLAIKEIEFIHTFTLIEWIIRTEKHNVSRFKLSVRWARFQSEVVQPRSVILHAFCILVVCISMS